VWPTDGSFHQQPTGFRHPVCRESATLSDAGRKLFAATRENRKTAYDAELEARRSPQARFISWRMPGKSTKKTKTKNHLAQLNSACLIGISFVMMMCVQQLNNPMSRHHWAPTAK
jgi:hypothetical protein